jgi:GH15 family glucan-1,4-alpha-glucosidase
VLAIADELSENGFVLRYRTDETDDGLSGKEGRSSSARSGWCPRWRSLARISVLGT